MTISSKFIIVSILFALILFVLAVGVDVKSNSNDKTGIKKFLVFERSYICLLVAYIFQFFCSDNSIIQIALIIVVWYSYCVILSSIISQIAYFSQCNKKCVSVLVSVLCYYCVGSILFEIMYMRFEVISNSTGINFVPGMIGGVIFYIIPVLIFFTSVIMMLVSYWNNHKKIREKYLLKVMVFAVVPCCVGIGVEYVCRIFDVYYPIFAIVLVLSYTFFKELQSQNYNFMLRREDFDAELDDSKTDIVFICDDNQKVIFMNNAAKIYGDMQKDSFLGRRLADIFLLDADIEREINNKDRDEGLMVPAVYPPVDKKIIMKVFHRYDCCKEILSSVVTIPNYEVARDEGNDGFYTKEDVIDNAFSEMTALPQTADVDDSVDDLLDMSIIAKGSRALLVGENVNDIAGLEKLFQPYDIEVYKAIGGRAAVEMLKKPAFDIIFVTYAMDKLSGVETVNRIRSLGKDYYSDVPVIFIVSGSIDSIYKDMLEVTFNDYIQKPISSQKLNLVLTRWLWRRYAISERYDYPSINTRYQRYISAMCDLYKDCECFMESENWQFFGYCLKGMKRICALIDSKDLMDACDETMDTYLLEEYSLLPECMEKLKQETENVKNDEIIGALF